MDTLNIIGCGAVGRVIGRLFHQANLFEMRDILNRSLKSGREAAAFIGAGRAVSVLTEMRQADLFLIAASDESLPGCAEALALSGVLRPGNVVCHLSGALSSEALAPVRQNGALIASVHPVKSFVDPLTCCADFAGTSCGIEGDPPAVELIRKAFVGIGGRVFSLDPSFKTVYHTGAVLVSNYLTSLVEVGVRAYERGGLPRETALEVMEPLLRGTVDNIFRVGTGKALTGPIARRDAAVVSAQVEALEKWDREIALIYRLLGRVALDLSRRERMDAVDEQSFLIIEKILYEKN